MHTHPNWRVERIGTECAPIEAFAISEWAWIGEGVPRRYGWVLREQVLTLEQAIAWIDANTSSLLGAGGGHVEWQV